jgi:hypothetical protein
MNAYELAYKLTNALGVDYEMMEQSAMMLRQQADRIAELEKQLNTQKTYVLDGKKIFDTTPQIKQLSDEELNKAFDYYCETDEGVLRFNYELRDEWKKEQLIRWKEAFKKASEK